MKNLFKSFFIFIFMFFALNGMETGRTTLESEIGESTPLKLKYQILLKQLAARQASQPAGLPQEILDNELNKAYGTLKDPDRLGLTFDEALGLYKNLASLDMERFDALVNLITKLQKTFETLSTLGPDQLKEIFAANIDPVDLITIRKSVLRNIFVRVFGSDWLKDLVIRSLQLAQEGEEFMETEPAQEKMEAEAPESESIFEEILESPYALEELRAELERRRVDAILEKLFKFDKELSVAYEQFLQAF